WSHRYSPFFVARSRYQFTRLTTQVTPFFANRTNVSGDAGITGNAQDPLNWGPPTIAFADFTGLADGNYQRSTRHSHVFGGEAQLRRGVHNLTFGGDARLYAINLF